MQQRFLRWFAAVWLAAAGSSVSAQPIDLPDLPQCSAVVPTAVALDNLPVTLDVRILLDGVSQQRAAQIVSVAQQAFSPLQLTLRPSYEARNLSGNDAVGLMQQAKARYGGRRPPGIDMVYVLTNKDITLEPTGNAAVGAAECIGGVAYPDRAFAVGEAKDIARTDLVVYSLAANYAAKAFAHEIGHLLGGMHEYANCGESAVITGDSPCTLMFNIADIQKLLFSTLNSTVVRANAQLFARP